MKTRAFTLIELLVVIAIIAVLMAILLPSLRLAKDQAHAIRCVSNQRSLTFSWLLYKDDFDAKMIGGHVGGQQDGKLIDWVDSPTGTGDPIEIKQQAIKRGLLWSYIKNFDVYRCPGDQRITRHNQDAFRSYSISGPMFGEERFSNWSERALWTYSEIKNPALRFVFVEEIDPRGHNMGSWVMQPDGSSWIDPLAIWHNKRSTFSYADLFIRGWQCQKAQMGQPVNYGYGGHSRRGDSKRCIQSDAPRPRTRGHRIYARRLPIMAC
ncbi:MAG: type II secretion system protein [Planctomycetota bacterium]